MCSVIAVRHEMDGGVDEVVFMACRVLGAGVIELSNAR